MKGFFLCSCFFSFLTILYATRAPQSGCLEREKALALLETAEDFLTKAKDKYPTCLEELNLTNETDCSKKKSLAYIEISKKLISDVKEKFPTCIGSKIIMQKHRDCSEVLASGQNKSGVYTIWPSESNAPGKPLQVYCDMETDDGGWTIIQRRGKFPVQRDFFKDWESYKNGFGNIKEEFWLGNENIRVLCHKTCKIRFDLQEEYSGSRFAIYQNFSLSGENYTIHITNFTGSAGDAMKNNNNYDFSARGRGNSEKVEKFQGGWWYGGDVYCNLNAVYQPGKSEFSSVFWFTFRSHGNLDKVEIKVLPN